MHVVNWDGEAKRRKEREERVGCHLLVLLAGGAGLRLGDTERGHKHSEDLLNDRRIEHVAMAEEGEADVQHAPEEVEVGALAHRMHSMVE